MRAVDQQLLGHATANDAGAADAIFLRHRDLRAMGRRHAGSPHAARSRADDVKVEVVVAHISLRCIAPAYGASPAELQIGIWLSSSRKRDGPARHRDRKSDVEGKSVSVRVAPGGGRIIKKKTMIDQG